MKKNIFVLFLLSFVCVVSAASADDYIYKSRNKLDFVKLDTAKKDEKETGINHPHDFEPDQIRAVLSSLNFNKKIIMLKDVENRNLFDAENVEFLTPHLVEAFKKAKPDQVVVVSYFTRDTHVIIQNDRLTIFRAYLKNDGLHLKFTKMYAKLLGDVGTLGVDRMAQNARGIRVSLELQPGQNRVAWDPEEIVMDLAQLKSPASVKEEPVKKVAKKEIVRKTKTETPAVETPAKVSSNGDGSKSVRDRLQELDQLRKDALITEKEYQAKKKDLLKEL
jgi:hypothetical protein